MQWARGKCPSWPLTLFCRRTRPDAVTEGLRHIEAVSIFLRGDSSQVSLVITPFIDVKLESYKSNAGCTVEIREQRVGRSLVDLAPPCGGEHLCLSVRMSPGSNQDFVISVKGATWPVRHELVALGCPREEQQDGSRQHRTPALNMTDRRVLSLAVVSEGDILRGHVRGDQFPHRSEPYSRGLEEWVSRAWYSSRYRACEIVYWGWFWFMLAG